MDRAVWAIFYDVGERNREVYLRWFHDVHIPEKLARRGYVSAGHYEVIGDDGGPASAIGGPKSRDSVGYVALFGGVDTGVFLNPSPAQIKPTQTPETQEMMARRIGSRSFIATQEWLRTSVDSDSGRGDAAIVLSCCDTPDRDEDFGAWCVQEAAPQLSDISGFQFFSKLLATTGPMKHATLAGFTNVEAALASKAHMSGSNWAKRGCEAQSHINGSPMVARRICPGS